jgi:hypothetical protein
VTPFVREEVVAPVNFDVWVVAGEEDELQSVAVD